MAEYTSKWTGQQIDQGVEDGTNAIGLINSGLALELPYYVAGLTEDNSDAEIKTALGGKAISDLIASITKGYALYAKEDDKVTLLSNASCTSTSVTFEYRRSVNELAIITINDNAGVYSVGVEVVTDSEGASKLSELEIDEDIVFYSEVSEGEALPTPEGGTVDLTNYYTKTDVDAKLAVIDEKNDSQSVAIDTNKDSIEGLTVGAIVLETKTDKNTADIADINAKDIIQDNVLTDLSSRVSTLESSGGGESGEGSYILPTATDSILGGVKIGENIDITDGSISVDLSNYLVDRDLDDIKQELAKNTQDIADIDEEIDDLGNEIQAISDAVVLKASSEDLTAVTDRVTALEEKEPSEGGTVDLSEYYKKTEADAITDALSADIQTNTDAIEALQLGGGATLYVDLPIEFSEGKDLTSEQVSELLGGAEGFAKIWTLLKNGATPRIAGELDDGVTAYLYGVAMMVDIVIYQIVMLTFESSPTEKQTIQIAAMGEEFQFMAETTYLATTDSGGGSEATSCLKKIVLSETIFARTDGDITAEEITTLLGMSLFDVTDGLQDNTAIVEIKTLIGNVPVYAAYGNTPNGELSISYSSATEIKTLNIARNGTNGGWATTTISTPIDKFTTLDGSEYGATKLFKHETVTMTTYYGEGVYEVNYGGEVDIYYPTFANACLSATYDTPNGNVDMMALGKGVSRMGIAIAGSSYGQSYTVKWSATGY